MTPEQREELRTKAEAFFFDVKIRPCAELLIQACDEIDRLHWLEKAVENHELARLVAVGHHSSDERILTRQVAISAYRAALLEAAKEDR